MTNYAPTRRSHVGPAPATPKVFFNHPPLLGLSPGLCGPEYTVVLIRDRTVTPSRILTPIPLCQYDMVYRDRIVRECSEGADIMKTTIEIDKGVLTQAQSALGTTTIKATVDASLREVVRQKQLRTLADALGTIPLELTSDQLRRQRAKRATHASR